MTFLYLLMFLLIVAEFVAADEDDIAWPPDLMTQYCADAMRPWEINGGVYEIESPSKHGKFNVYCIKDSEGGPAWTVILRRMDGSVNFSRNRSEYKSGFGDLNGEYFLGLRKIHQLTKSTENELWVELIDFQNETRHAKYSEFSVSGPDERYALNVANYTGNAGDALSYSNGREFQTPKKNNCASKHGGSWWMNACTNSLLTGEYKSYSDRMIKKDFIFGIYWSRFHLFESLQFALMAIRPVKFSGIRE